MTKGSSKTAIADLEAKVVILEQEKAALQQCLDKSAEEKATLTTELLATAEGFGENWSGEVAERTS